MKPLKITYIRLSGKTEPYGAFVGGHMLTRQCNETLANFQARCEAFLDMMKEK